jgi:hypothetical protein
MDRDLAWLQDTAAQHVWTAWRVVYRDVVILDANGVPVGVFNLTTHDLANVANRNALIALLKLAAGE